MRLDVAAIFASTAGLTLTVIFSIAVLALRSLLALAHRGVIEFRQRTALGLYSAPTLSLVVALGETGVSNGLIAAVRGGSAGGQCDADRDSLSDRGIATDGAVSRSGNNSPPREGRALTRNTTTSATISAVAAYVAVSVNRMR